jgi:hypothetical protein
MSPQISLILIDSVKVTLGKRNIMDGIQDIGLARPIVACKTIKTLGKLNLQRLVVLKLLNIKRF